MIRPSLYVDIDGVVADSVTVALEEINHHFGTHWEYNDVVTYNPTLGGVVFGEAIDSLMSSPEHIIRCEPYPGVAEALVEIGQKYDITLITKRLDVNRATVTWLNEHYIPRNHVVMDRDMHRSFFNGDILVDDNEKNLEGWAPRVCILFSQPWNVRVDDQRFIRKAGWNEVKEFLLAFDMITKGI